MLAGLITWIKLQAFWRARAEFYEELAASYAANEALREFLNEELRISMTPATANPSRVAALRIMRSRLAGGESVRLSTIIGPALPQNDSMMLAAVDDAKDKPALLRSIAQAVREQKLLRSLVLQKAIPPLLLFPGAFAFAYIMATQSLPVIVKIAPAAVWESGMNGYVRAFASFLAVHGFTSLVAVLAVAAVFTRALPRWIGRWRAKLEAVSPSTALLLFPVCPFLVPLSIFRDVQVGLLFSALAVMLRSGRTLTDALATIRRNSQPWMRWHLRKVLQHLETNPTEYRQAFSKGLMSPLLLSRLSSQMRTNPNFDAVLVRLGLEGSVEIRKVVDRQMSVINAFLLSVGGAVVVFMMVGQLNISQSLTEELSPAKQMQRIQHRPSS
jgi:type II secretory pathway component PulF